VRLGVDFEGFSAAERAQELVEVGRERKAILPNTLKRLDTAFTNAELR
jgi:hypothetical protein